MTWPTARQQLSNCSASPEAGLACACFRVDLAAARSSGGPLSLAEKALSAAPDPAGFRCLGAGNFNATLTTEGWRADCVLASDSGVPGGFHCLCACGGGGYTTCADVCHGSSGACPTGAAAVAGDLCQLYPPAASLTGPLVAALAGFVLLALTVRLAMSLVRCPVPFIRARLRSCWLACPPGRLMQRRQRCQAAARGAAAAPAATNTDGAALAGDMPDERRPLEEAAEDAQADSSV